MSLQTLIRRVKTPKADKKTKFLAARLSSWLSPGKCFLRPETWSRFICANPKLTAWHSIFCIDTLLFRTLLLLQMMIISFFLVFSGSPLLPCCLAPRAPGWTSRLGCWCCITRPSSPSSTSCALPPSTSPCYSLWLRWSLKSSSLLLCLKLKNQQHISHVKGISSPRPSCFLFLSNKDRYAKHTYHQLAK